MGHENTVTEREPQRTFRGVWIRRSLWERTDLTWFEKCLLCQIDSYESCFASNAFLANRMGTTEQTIQNAISKFRKLSLVIDWGERGNNRQMTVADCVASDPINSHAHEKITQIGKPRSLPAVNPGVYIEQRGEQRVSTERLRQAETIYKEYPLKVGKPDALRAIIRQLKKYSFDDLLAKTASYREIRKGNLKYVPHPTTWFNQERFNDDVSTWMPKEEPSPVKKQRKWEILEG